MSASFLAEVLGRYGQGEKAEQFLQWMRVNKLQPNAITMSVYAQALAKRGERQSLLTLLRSMESMHGVRWGASDARTALEKLAGALEWCPWCRSDVSTLPPPSRNRPPHARYPSFSRRPNHQTFAMSIKSSSSADLATAIFAVYEDLLLNSRIGGHGDPQIVLGTLLKRMMDAGSPLEDMEGVLERARAFGIPVTTTHHNMALAAVGRSGSYDEALGYARRMGEADRVTLETLLNSAAWEGRVAEAERQIGEMLKRDEVRRWRGPREMLRRDEVSRWRGTREMLRNEKGQNGVSRASCHVRCDTESTFGSYSCFRCIISESLHCVCARSG